jgi:hypothetical protein
MLCWHITVKYGMSLPPCTSLPGQATLEAPRASLKPGKAIWTSN